MPRPTSWQRQFGLETFQDGLRQQRLTEAQVRRLLREASEQISQQIYSHIGPRGLDVALRQATYEEIRIVLSQIERQLWLGIRRTVEDGVSSMTQRIVRQQSHLASILGDALGVEERAILQDAVEAMTDRIRLNYLNTYDISPRIDANILQMRGRIDAVVEQGIAREATARQIAGDVGRLIRPNSPGGTSYNATRLSRTELNESFHRVSRASYQGQPWVEALKWELSGSHPEPDVCDELAENDENNLGRGVWPKLQTPSPPHPHCMCHLVPITVSRREFVSQYKSGQYDRVL